MKKKNGKKEVNYQEFFENNFENFRQADEVTIQKTKAKLAKFRASKEARINMRVNEADLELFKIVAEEKGIPYQTLLNHVIHEYAAGNLVDVKELAKILPNLKKVI